jgi:hypothetical protein
MLQFEQLKSDEVFLVGMLASDVASLWRRLVRTPEVQNVARGLASDPENIAALCRFVRTLLAQPHASAFRHPNDVAISAALVILQASPLSVVRCLFAELKRLARPSLFWVRRIAEYCDERFAENERPMRMTLTTAGARFPLFDGDKVSDVRWSDGQLEAERLSLSLAC